MDNDTVLTDQQALDIWNQMNEPFGRELFRVSHYSFARAIEQAVLQSAEVQRLREDAARLDWLDATNAPFKMGWRFGIAPAGNVHPYTVIQLYGALTTVREGIDAAMEKQP